MTTKQKQALLAYLGYYDGTLDGIWGELVEKICSETVYV